MDKAKSPIDILFLALTFLSMIGALFMVFIYAPVEKTMGIVQKIFYFHVPTAWIAFFAFSLVFLWSILYLIRREKRWDTLASASAEVGILFCTLVLITGPLWAKPAWGVWWTWDARLTITLVLWLTYVGYLMLRHYVVDPERKAVLSAVLGVIGFIDVPLAYMSIRWWRTQHPKPVIAGGPESGLDPAMRLVFAVCLAAFAILFAYLVTRRVKLEELREELEELRDRAGERERI